MTSVTPPALPRPGGAGEHASGADARARQRAAEARPEAPVTRRELPETTPAVPALPRAPAAEASRVAAPQPARAPAHRSDVATPGAADRAEPQQAWPVQLDTSLPPRPVLTDPDDVVGPEM